MTTKSNKKRKIMKTIKRNPIVLVKVVSYSLFAVAGFVIAYEVIKNGSSMF